MLIIRHTAHAQRGRLADRVIGMVVLKRNFGRMPECAHRQRALFDAVIFSAQSPGDEYREIIRRAIADFHLLRVGFGQAWHQHFDGGMGRFATQQIYQLIAQHRPDGKTQVRLFEQRALLLAPFCGFMAAAFFEILIRAERHVVDDYRAAVGDDAAQLQR